jgi:hypothetical protein
MATFKILCMAWKTSHRAYFETERKNGMELDVGFMI